MQETKTSNLPAVQTLQYTDHNSFSKAILDRICQDQSNQAVVDSYLSEQYSNQPLWEVWDIISTVVFYDEVSNGDYLSMWEYTDNIESLSNQYDGTKLEFAKLVLSEYNNLIADMKKEYNDDVRVYVYW
ncbi:MAG: hypothetical protein ACMV1B_11460 [Prevotella sp.]